MLRSGPKDRNTLKEAKTTMTIIESAEWVSSDELVTAISFRSQPGDHLDTAYSQFDIPQGLGRGLSVTTLAGRRTTRLLSFDSDTIP